MKKKNLIIKNFLLTTKEGNYFLKKSKDKNIIHSKNFKFHNSFYEHPIAFGCLFVSKFINKNSHVKKNNFLNIIFLDGIAYNYLINIKGNKSNFYFFQKKKLKAIITTKKDADQEARIEKSNIKKKYFFFKKKFLILKKISLTQVLEYLSRYVGTIIPGNRSIILEIKIFITNKLNENFSKKSNFLYIKSFFLDKKLFLIKNCLVYKNIFIVFITTKIPLLRLNYKKVSKKNLNIFYRLRKNVLIIGASSGIGNNLLRLFSKNNKIKIFGIYFSKKIILSKKNIYLKKIDVRNQIYKIYEIIKKNSPLNIYYFASPRITKTYNNLDQIRLYKEYYINIPLKIVNFLIKNKIACNLFIPSTTYINKLINYNDYTKIKLLCEKKFKSLNQNQKYVKINILRIPEINTRNNLSIIQKNKLPDFQDIIFNKKFLKKLFLI